MWTFWQYLAHAEPVQRIERDQPIPWAVEAEIPVRPAGLPTALLVTACFLVPTPPAAQVDLSWAQPLSEPQSVVRLVDTSTGGEFLPRTLARPVDWLPELDLLRIDPVLVDVATGAEFIAPAIVRDLPIPWQVALSEPTRDIDRIETSTGAEWIPAIAEVEPIPWYQPLSEPVILQVVAATETGAEVVPPRVAAVTAIAWAHQTELPTLPIPPSLYGTGGEHLPVTIAPSVTLAWYVPMAEPPATAVFLTPDMGAESVPETVVRIVVDRRVADFPDRVGSRSNRPRNLGPI